jgi:molybdopterin-binding protein
MNAKTYLKCKSGEIITGHINPEIVFALLTKFLHFFSPSLAADNKESCTSLVARMPVEIVMRQGELASKGSVIVSFRWFTHMNAKTYLKCKSGEIITGHINPEIVFRRALVLANSRDDVTIDNILSHPIEPHFRTASLDLIYKTSSLCHLHGTWTPG